MDGIKDTDPFALGRRAAAMLDAQLKGCGKKGAGKKRGTVLHAPRRVVERSSTNMYPFRTPWLAEAVTYIRKNLTKGVTAEEVVEHIGYSHPTVARAFIEELGHPIKREILLQRNRLARRLLRQTKLTAGEISVRCGYRSPQYFSRSFVEEFGTTPDEWRRRF